MSNTFTVHVAGLDRESRFFAWMVCCEACGELMPGAEPEPRPLISITSAIHGHLYACPVRPFRRVMPDDTIGEIGA